MASEDVSERHRTLSSGGRGVVDMLAASQEPLSYEVMRHVLRLTEADMVPTLAEAVNSGLVRRIEGYPPAYELEAGVAGHVRESLGEERLERLRRQVTAARDRVHGAG